MKELRTKKSQIPEQEERPGLLALDISLRE